MGKIIKPLIYILMFLSAVRTTLAQDAKFIIINQLRGSEECCQPGDSKLINTIKSNKSFSNLKIGWALRYDWLFDNNPQKIFNNNDELGLLLEVTPRLASDSGVAYKGKADGSDWYYAKNSFLIGYTQEERKKLTDQLFSSFKKKMGFYPSFTAGWMIDSWSLDYLNKHYGVKLHELTKEQYETDSYTLYGGVFNFPYYPSIYHPLVPGWDQNKLNLLIIRQTISDLLKNYGSPKSYYTSQPNDYLESKESLNFSYFQQLVSDALHQSLRQRFAVLGFENSFTSIRYIEEYQKQLEYIADLQDKNQLKIYTPSGYTSEYKKEFQENPSFFLDKDFSPENKIGALWYFGKNYRARIIHKDQKLILDDLRIYSDIQDPYTDFPASADYSYWTIPYIFDSSQQYQRIDKNFEKKFQDLIGSATAPDFLTDPFGIVLGKGKFKVMASQESIEIIFDEKNQGKVKLASENILLDKRLDPYINSQKNENISDLMNKQKTIIPIQKHFDMVIKYDNDNYYLGWENDGKFVELIRLNTEDEQIILTPITNQSNLYLLDTLFQPDRSRLSIDKGKSIFYWNNKTAIAGRNPVRLFILPQNNLGRPVGVKDLEVVSADKKKLEIVYPQDYNYRIKPWFIDVSSRSSLETKISIKIDGIEIIKDAQIKFITDCQNNTKDCIKHPSELIKYIWTIIDEKRKEFDKYLSTI